MRFALWHRPPATRRKRRRVCTVAGELIVASEVLLFIDTNQFLPIFGQSHGKKLLASIDEQRGHIFITKQIVDEVNRNKLKLAADFFAVQLEKLPLSSFAVPDHLFGLGDEFPKGLGEHLKKLNESLAKVKGETTNLVLRTLAEISSSEDVTSKRLEPLFASAAAPSNDELSRARDRRERGNPPGKPDDPLGDQLSWEQLLTRCTGIKRLWLITKDRDYCTKIEKKLILNPLLHSDLKAVSSDIQVKCFDQLSHGIVDFTKNSGVTSARLPNADEIKAIEKEEESFPDFEAMSQRASALLEKLRSLNYPGVVSATCETESGGTSTDGGCSPFVPSTS